MITHPRRRSTALSWLTALATLVVLLAVPSAARASSPLDDPFFTYSGTKPLAEIPAGTVLKTRTVPYHLAGVRLPLEAVQLLYRSRDQQGRATVNVTSVIRSLDPVGKPKVVSFQSEYDSLNPEDQPSARIAGGTTLGGLLVDAEAVMIAPLVLGGYTIVIPDIEGQQANFTSGPEAGMNTLDSLRAAFSSQRLGLEPTTKAALLGYSGGGIGTEWAGELATTYAPDVARRLNGIATAGLPVHFAHNLQYIDGSAFWTGVIPMAVVGLSRSFDIDLTPYLNDYGMSLVRKSQAVSILQSNGQYPGLTWAKIAKPADANPASIPEYVETVNKIIMGTGGTPNVPMLIGQGTGGYLEGTLPGKAGIGAGDGVMVAGDVRSLSRDYCRRGVKVQYDEFNGLSHVLTALAWLPKAYRWIDDRFAGRTAPSSCGSIAPGNSLAPVKLVPAG